MPTLVRRGGRSSWPATARCPARLELRSGAAAEHVVKVAGAEQADVIALAWSQRLEPGRALVVRRAVLDTGMPVMLVPMPAC